MLNRRLIFLFVLFAVGIVVIGVRLVRLQVLEADYWREEMREFVHHHRVVETYRGSILDRFGNVVAQDVACNDLAIDYRAMNLDDRWLTRTAVARLKGEKFATRADYQERVEEVKEQIAAQIEAMPETIAKLCGLSVEDVQLRINDVRARIQALHQDLWGQRFVKGGAVSDEDLDASYQKDDLREDRIPHTIIPNVSNEVANYFDVHESDYPGLIVLRDSTRRFYPYNDVACQVIGTLRSVNADTIKDSAQKFDMPNLLKDGGADAGNLRGYLPADLMGESGVEKVAEGTLRGARGVRLVQLGETLGDSTDKIDPVPGKDVKLTLDMGMQRDVENDFRDPGKKLLEGRDLKNHLVGMVVMNMQGEILVMISWPTYDLNAIDDERVALNKDVWHHPLWNRTLVAYPPGSTVKPLLASGALMDGVIDSSMTVNCTGHFYPNQPNKFGCDKAHGVISLVNAISESCNIYFYTVGQKLKIGGLTKWYDNYGLGKDTGCELPEAEGSVAHPENYGEADTALYESMFEGIGQGKITATPLQMANAYATLLRGGVMVKPRIVAGGAMESKQVLPISAENLRLVRMGMERCVTSGTAKKYFSDMRLPVGAKTGTAQVPLMPLFDDAGKPVDDLNKPVLNADGTAKLDGEGKPMYKQAVGPVENDAWFVAYAPANNPQYVVAAIMEQGGHGGLQAAPMARDAILQLERHNYLPHMDVP